MLKKASQFGSEVVLAALGDAAMSRMGNCVLSFLFVVILGVAGSVSSADEPGWQGNVIARGSEREKIQSTPILERPYRPLHFYGNTARRRHYRGTAAPAPRDVAGAAGAAVRSR